ATVWEAAAGGLSELLALESSLLEQAHALGDDPSEEALARYGHDLERFEREGGYEATARIDAVLSGLGFDPQEARTAAVAQLSGGHSPNSSGRLQTSRTTSHETLRGRTVARRKDVGHGSHGCRDSARPLPMMTRWPSDSKSLNGGAIRSRSRSTRPSACR